MQSRLAQRRREKETLAEKPLENIEEGLDPLTILFIPTSEEWENERFQLGNLNESQMAIYRPLKSVTPRIGAQRYTIYRGRGG